MSKKGKGKKRKRSQTWAPAPAIMRKPLSQAKAGGDKATIRMVEGALASQNQLIKHKGHVTVVSKDSAIPLDRVPYFVSDLVRLVVVAAAMIVLLVVGTFLVPVVINRFWPN